MAADHLLLENPKKRKRMRAVNKAPSETKWEDIQDIGIVTSDCDFSQFKENVLLVKKNAALIQSCESPELTHFQHCHSVLVKKLCSDNVGFPLIKYSLLFSHLTSHLGDDYKLKIYPQTVTEESIKSQTITVLNLRNRRTVLVCELKFGISEEMSVLEDEFSQLLQEVRYAYDTDTQSSANHYKYMLAILGDHLIWHVLLIHCFCKPYTIVDLYVIHVKDVDLGILCFFLQQCIVNLS